MTNYSLFKLKNGATLVVLSLKNSLSASCVAMVKAGPRFDPSGKEGLSHFVEHMICNGSQKWPSQFKLSSALEKIGAIDYAFSYREVNRYSIKCQNEKIVQSVENLIDRVSNPIFNEKDIAPTIKVIKQEYLNLLSNPDSLNYENWSETLWPNNPLGRYYLGKPEIFSKISRNDVFEFWRNEYVPQNTVFAVAGDINPRTIYKVFNKNLTTSPSQVITRTHSKKSGSYFGNIVYKRTGHEALSLIIGFKTIPFENPDMTGLGLIGQILAGGMSSRLRQKLMNKGHVYSVDSFSENFSDGGFLAITLNTSTKSFQKVISIAIDEFLKLTTTPVTTGELELAKEYYCGTISLELETSLALAEWYCYAALQNPLKIISPKEKIEATRKIEPGELVQLAKKYFRKEFLSISVVGNLNKSNLKFLESLGLDI